MPEENGLVPDGEELTDLDAVPEGDETRELADPETELLDDAGLVPETEYVLEEAVPVEGRKGRELAVPAEMDGLLAVPDLDGLFPWLGEDKGLPVPDADVDFEREVPDGLADLEMLVPDEVTELLAVAERDDPVS